MWRVLLTLMLGLGCGRIGFDPSGDASSLTADAFVAVGPCPYGATAADPIAISGTTEDVATFSPEPGVTVEASLSVGGPVIAQTTSDNSGRYTLSIPTGGRPISPVISLRKTPFMVGTWMPDAPIAASIPSFYSPMGRPSGVDTLYVLGGAGARDPGMGTLFLQLMDCTGAPLSGVTFSVSPAAERITYAGVTGSPSTLLTSTSSRGFGWALNVPPGQVTLSASKSGETFLMHTITVLAGDNFMGSRLRPVQ